MRAAEEGTRQWGMRCDRIGRCQEWELGEQEVVEKGQPEVVTAEWAGPGYSGLAGFSHTQCDFLVGGNLLIDHHPVVV